MKKIPLLALFLVLVSCQSNNVPPNEDMEKKVGFWEGATCNLPCWINIIPGVTTTKQAQNILYDSELTVNVRSSITADNIWGNRIQWDFSDSFLSTYDYGTGGIIFFDPTTDLVFELIFKVDGILEYYLQNFGKPSHYAVLRQYNMENTCEVELFYVKENYSFTVQTECNIRTNRPYVHFDKRNEVIGVTSMSDLSLNDLIGDPGFQMFVWEGYGKHSLEK